jgi:hypothetical protein
MEYTAQGVATRLDEAMARSTRQWVPGAETEVQAIERVRDQFASSVITPEVGQIEVDNDLARVLNVEAGPRKVWLLTDVARHRVFFDAGTESFGAAWGPDAATGCYWDLGFRTDDPIDAFLT